MSEKKIKKKKQEINSKLCTNCFSPTYMKFNFSFIVHDEGFEDKYKIQLFERIRELSKEPYIIVSQQGKERFLEFEKNRHKKRNPKRI